MPIRMNYWLRIAGQGAGCEALQEARSRSLLGREDQTYKRSFELRRWCCYARKAVGISINNGTMISNPYTQQYQPSDTREQLTFLSSSERLWYLFRSSSLINLFFTLSFLSLPSGSNARMIRSSLRSNSSTSASRVIRPNKKYKVSGRFGALGSFRRFFFLSLLRSPSSKPCGAVTCVANE